MSYENARYKNTGNDEGDILNFFNNQLRNLVQKNGGDNTYSVVSENCHDKDTNVPMNTKTKLKLTHSAHSISQFEKGFINMNLELKLKLNHAPEPKQYSKYDNHHENNIIFVGFKDAVEVISDVQFWVDGKLIDGYNQSEMIKESFAYNSIRSADSKRGAPHSHSLWESVQAMSPNVCGVFIPMSKFEKTEKDNKGIVTVNMELIIPYTDQLALQAWRLYPNRILGEMEEEVKFSTAGLVWCQLQPATVAEINKFWNPDPQVFYGAPFVPITNKFTQIGQEAIIVNKITKESADGKDGEGGTSLKNKGKPEKLVYKMDTALDPAQEEATHWYVRYELAANALEVDSCQVTECKTNCAGFGIKPEVMEGILQGLQQPIIIPAQELSKFIFESRGSGSTMTLSKSIPLRNATNITMMFPKHSADCTVFDNIMYENVRLTVNKKRFPETDFENTWDGRFVQYQLQANELDGLEPTQEFLESISRPLCGVNKSNETTYGKRMLFCPFDNTSFGINFQLERGNSGYVFDGIDTGSHAITVEFKGTALFDKKVNPHLSPDLKVGGNCLQVSETDKEFPLPEMWVCSDTYWTWSVEDGVRYYQRGIPAGYD